jgi:hypothetical protein
MIHPHRCWLAGALLVATSTAFADPSEGTTKFGDYLIHHNALSTEVLSADMARQYAIERSPSRGMLNISVQKIAADETAAPVAAEIHGEATNLSGLHSPVTIREIPGDYVSYVGLFDVSPPDTYTFVLTIKPSGSDQTHTLRFNQNFVAD